MVDDRFEHFGRHVEDGVLEHDRGDSRAAVFRDLTDAVGESQQRLAVVERRGSGFELLLTRGELLARLVEVGLLGIQLLLACGQLLLLRLDVGHDRGVDAGGGELLLGLFELLAAGIELGLCGIQLLLAGVELRASRVELGPAVLELVTTVCKLLPLVGQLLLGLERIDRVGDPVEVCNARHQRADGILLLLIDRCAVLGHEHHGPGAAGGVGNLFGEPVGHPPGLGAGNVDGVDECAAEREECAHAQAQQHQPGADHGPGAACREPADAVEEFCHDVSFCLEVCACLRSRAARWPSRVRADRRGARVRRHRGLCPSPVPSGGQRPQDR